MKRLDKHAITFTAEEAAKMGLRMEAGTARADEAATEAGFKYVTGNATVWIDDPEAFMKFIEETMPDFMVTILKQRLAKKDIAIQELALLLAQAKERETAPKTVKKKLDETDRAILSLVQEDPSMTDKELVAKIQIGRQAISVRRNRLEAAGYEVRASKRKKKMSRQND